MKYFKYFLELIIFIVSMIWTRPSNLDVLNINIDTRGHHEDRDGQKDYLNEAGHHQVRDGQKDYFNEAGIEHGKQEAVVIDREEEEESIVSNSCGCAKAGPSLTSYLRSRPSSSDYHPSIGRGPVEHNNSTDYVGIVNGPIVYPKYKYPYQVHVTIHNSITCGGTIINKRYVLTAMHCLFENDENENDKPLPVEGSFVVVGEHNYMDGVNEGGQRLEVARFIKRNDYYHTSNTLHNDIALLELKTDMRFTDRVKPACLPTDDTETYEGEWGIVSGWGSTVGSEPGEEVKQEYPHELKETSVKILDLNDCDQELSRNEIEFDPVGTLCDNTPRTGPCNGDSGGPMVVVENGVYTLVGVISYGFGCASRIPQLYTRVSHYLTWIASNARSGECSG